MEKKEGGAPFFGSGALNMLSLGFLSVTPPAERACMLFPLLLHCCVAECRLDARAARRANADERFAKTNEPGVFSVRLLTSRPARSLARVRACKRASVIWLLRAAAALQSTSCILTQSLRHK